MTDDTQRFLFDLKLYRSKIIDSDFNNEVKNEN